MTSHDKTTTNKIKRWGIHSNCFTTRAIHLEVVKSYDSNSSIGSFQRLANRRDKHGDVYSDCGTNLKSAKSKLNIKIQPINEYSSNEQISSHFNPPAAPHMGGIWERITRTVKIVIFSMIINTSFTDFQLMTKSLVMSGKCQEFSMMCQVETFHSLCFSVQCERKS